MAGTSSSFQGSRPNRRCASYIPATVPGTPTERWPVSDELMALPAVSTYMSRRSRGSGLAEVERADRALLHPGDQKPASPDVARHRVDDRQRECDRHRGVDGVAAA